MALVFSTSDKAVEDHGVKALVFGNAGAGKTVFCSTAPAPLIISAESGLMSIRHKKIPIVQVSDIKDVEEAYTWCQLNGRKSGIQTICLDSISEITEKCLVSEKNRTKDPRQAYGEMATRVIELTKKFRDLAGFHVVVACKQTQIVDAITGVAKAVPLAPGQQVGPALPYLFDLVLYAYTDVDPATNKKYHALRTRASYNYEAKDRSGVLDEIEYPDFSNIIRKIQATPAAA